MKTTTKEPKSVITVRLSKKQHEELKEEAREKKVSMNRLCVFKLCRVEPPV